MSDIKLKGKLIISRSHPPPPPTKALFPSLLAYRIIFIIIENTDR